MLELEGFAYFMHLSQSYSKKPLKALSEYQISVLLIFDKILLKINFHYYRGDVKNDKLHGEGVYSWKDGRSYSGQFKNNKMHGNGVFKWATGKYC